METMTKDKMVIYQYGKTHIQDVLIEGADGVFRTQCEGLTFKEYVERGKWDCVCITLDKAVELIEELNTKQFIKPFHEISEEKYMEMLECLPPEKWQTVDGVNIFRMSEYTTGIITGHYASYEGKYYTAERRTTTPYAEIAKEIKSIN